MELILTEAEREANTWLELDNETVGKVIKALALKTKFAAEEDGKLVAYAAALLLIGMAAEANADTMKETIEGLSIGGKDYGTWELTIKFKGFKTI